MEMNKFYCDRSTCPGRQKQKDESSIQSCSVEGIYKKADKDTQMSDSITSTSSERTCVPAKTCEKSSEAYFDRNNQNISSSYNKFCPSNSSQTSETESPMCAVLVKYPAPTQVNKPHCCVNITPTSSGPGTSRNKCSGKQLYVTSSSSSSITSEHFPVKLRLKPSTMENKMPLPKIRQLTNEAKPIFVTSTAPRSERLQPLTTTNYLSSDCEQFYSCSSEDSESDSTSSSFKKLPAKLLRSRKRCKTDKNYVILELLHELVHLINKVTPSLDEKSSKMTTQESEIKEKCKQKDLKPPTTVQFTPLTWPPPCLCDAHGMAFGQGQSFNMPVMPPYNLMSPAAAQIPEPFVYEVTDDSFKDCSSGNKSLIADKISNVTCCLCSNTTTICPKHRPLKPVCSCPSEEQQPNKEPSPDCLLAYDNEEPNQTEDIADVDEEIQPIFAEQNPFLNYEPSPDCLMIYDDEDPSWPDLINTNLENPEATEVEDLEFHNKSIEDHVTSSHIVVPEDPVEPKEAEKLDNAELDKSSQHLTDNGNETLNVTETERSSYIVETSPTTVTETERSPSFVETSPTTVTETERSPSFVETSPTTEQNVCNFLAEIDGADVGDYRQIIRYNESEEGFDSYYREEESELLGEEECELAKEKRTENRKKKKADADDIASTALATMKQLEGEGSREEMKFFIDSLIMDFEAMEYARRRSQFEKNICKYKLGLCAHDSFPVTITEITDLGANSLYVKWTIHDCCGIGGYEIYTDGCLTNRYYNSRHEAAVITHVDVTLPHKVALVAQPTADDESLELMCNLAKSNNKTKCLPWKTDVGKEHKSYAALWTPSIFLYDPVTCRASAAPPIMRDNC